MKKITEIAIKICPQCKKEFSYFAIQNFMRRKFCSRKCLYLFPVSDETKKRVSENNYWKGRCYWTGKTGDKHPNWRGGLRTNKEYRKQYNRGWRIKNRNRINFRNQIRRCLKKNAIGSYTYEQWDGLKKQYNFTCPACNRREPEIRLSQDHIIPLSKGGTNFIENIQPLCRSCNSSKHTKIIKYERSVVCG